MVDRSRYCSCAVVTFQGDSDDDTHCVALAGCLSAAKVTGEYFRLVQACNTNRSAGKITFSDSRHHIRPPRSCSAAGNRRTSTGSTIFFFIPRRPGVLRHWLLPVENLFADSALAAV